MFPCRSNRFVFRSHYTERKKCGPRSGQKTFRGPRRTRVSPDPAAANGATTSSALQRQQRHTTDATLPNHMEVGVPSSSAGASSKCTLESSYEGLRLSPVLPPSHATPTLSAGELSGETTGVDYTDCSDGPPPRQMLNRDESGSSWWSLEEQGGAPASTSSFNTAATTTPWVQHDNSRYDGGGGGGGQFGGRGGRENDGQHWGGGAVGAMSGVSGGSGGSGGSGVDSSGDDSDEGLCQAEEEVAALLVRLGKTNTYFEGFPGDVNARASSSTDAAGAHMSRDSEQRCWGVVVCKAVRSTRYMGGGDELDRSS